MIALISACGQRVVLQGMLVSLNPTTIPLYDSVLIGVQQYHKNQQDLAK